MHWLLLSIPFLGGLFCFAIARDSFRRSLLLLCGAGHLATLLHIWHRGLNTPLGDWLGIDALGLVFLLITSLLFLLASLYAWGYFARHEIPEEINRRFSREAIFTGTMLIFGGAMTLALLSRHTGIFWMAIEGTTLANAPLICHQRSARSLEAAWKYLLICSVGIALALIGNIALAMAASLNPVTLSLPLTFSHLAEHAHLLQPLWLKVAFAFLLVGYGTKMGLAPMHTWLPDSYSESPVPAALLSGALLNCAFLGLLRLNLILVKAGLGDFSNHLLVGFGLLSMLLAGWFIVQQTDFKRLLAYSSIEHMGILAVAAGAGVQTHFGAILHTLTHSLTKGMLFLVAGNILSAYHCKSSREVRGVLAHLPVSGALWLAGFLAICGVPPFGTFVSEFSIMTGLGQGHHWLTLGLMLFALGVIFVGMARVVIPMAYGTPNDSLPVPGPSPFSTQLLPPLILGCFVFILGCWIPAPLNQLLQQAAQVIGAN
jgi:hydrogenase-4 component F